MIYKIPRWQKQDLPDYYVQRIDQVRSSLMRYKNTRLEVIFGYELYYVEHCFLRAERKGSIYWAEKGIQKAEQVINATASYSKALEEPIPIPVLMGVRGRFSQLLRRTLNRFAIMRPGEVKR